MSSLASGMPVGNALQARLPRGVRPRRGRCPRGPARHCGSGGGRRGACRHNVGPGGAGTAGRGSGDPRPFRVRGQDPTRRREAVQQRPTSCTRSYRWSWSASWRHPRPRPSPRRRPVGRPCRRPVTSCRSVRAPLRGATVAGMSAHGTTASLPAYKPGTCRRWTGSSWCARTDILGVWQAGPLCQEHAPAPVPARISGCECPQCTRPASDDFGATVREDFPQQQQR